MSREIEKAVEPKPEQEPAKPWRPEVGERVFVRGAGLVTVSGLRGTGNSYWIAGDNGQSLGSVDLSEMRPVAFAEPKSKPPITRERFLEIAQALQNAETAPLDHNAMNSYAAKTMAKGMADYKNIWMPGFGPREGDPLCYPYFSTAKTTLGDKPTTERTTTMKTIKFDTDHACPYCGATRIFASQQYEFVDKPTGAAIIITCGRCGAKFLMLAKGEKLPKPPRGERGPKGERGLLAKAAIGTLKYAAWKPFKYCVVDTLHEAKQGASRTVGNVAGIAGLFALVCWLVPYAWTWFLSVLPW